MKRSEMVQILKDAVIKHMNCVDCCNSDDEVYSKVLQILEDNKIGVLCEWEQEFYE